jgi:anti-anti-sigma factor
MPQAQVVTSSRPASRCAAPTFVCTSKTGSSAAWIQAAGELDFAASLELGRTLREARLSARLLVLDLRELTFIDSSGVGVILDAARRAQRAGGRLMLVRGPVPVDRVLALTGISSEVLMFDLDPGEPSPALVA